MFKRIESALCKTSLNYLEFELERELTDSQRAAIIREIRKIIASFVKEQNFLDILALKPINVVCAFIRFAEDEIKYKKDVTKPSLRMWRRFVKEMVSSPEDLEYYLQ